MALALLSEFWQTGLLPTTATFGAATSACEHGSDWPQALSLLSVMQTWGPAPNLIVFNATISACEKGHEWPRALHLLGRMREGLCLPDVVSCTAAASACAGARRWARALGLLRLMQQYREQPDMLTYTAGMDACENSSQAAPALGLLPRVGRHLLGPLGCALRPAGSPAARARAAGLALGAAELLRRGGLPAPGPERLLLRRVAAPVLARLRRLRCGPPPAAPAGGRLADDVLQPQPSLGPCLSASGLDVLCLGCQEVGDRPQGPGAPTAVEGNALGAAAKPGADAVVTWLRYSLTSAGRAWPDGLECRGLLVGSGGSVIW